MTNGTSAIRRTAASVSRMCAENAMAHSSTSPSPSGCSPPPTPESSANPTAEAPAASQTRRSMRRRSTTAASSGVITTASPVMNPALDAEVRVSPNVCSA